MIESCKKDGVWDLHKLDLFVLHRCWTGSEVVQTPIFFVGHSISKTISPLQKLPRTNCSSRFVVLVRFVPCFFFP